ncbi:hypothetical protein JCM24511_05166 [Saitozyma sp. JCM 24511]|nr:hypothetical protein JCM24511_05166 [Saitozyma sp. JCM 24511]
MSPSAASVPLFEAELLLECQNVLGEGILWDSKEKLLHWVDIDTAEVHTLEPKSMKYSVDSYAGETKYITALALRESEPGFIGTTQDKVALFPSPTPPTEVTTAPTRTSVQTTKTLSKPLPEEFVADGTTRFNDGGCDPKGRFFAGSMALPELQDGKKRGVMWRIDPDGKQTPVMDNIDTSNGIGWSPDGKTMYYIDSGADELLTFAYDTSTGTFSDRKVFQSSVAPIDASKPTQGVFDGLCLDGVGNIWVARWSDERIVGFSPDGKQIANIKVPLCKSPTIPCFGGDNLETMYIATAHSKLAGKGDIQSSFPNSGDLFKVDFSQGSAIRKVLGEGWKGAERHRFAA